MKATFLDEIISVTSSRVKFLAKSERDDMAVRAREVRRKAEALRLSKALEQRARTNIIAEIKRASPSKGVINDKINVAETAKMYEREGACAISVLTEGKYFRGSIDDLRVVRRTVDVPILRKDFTVDEFQIYEAAEAGADAVLLIVAALSSETLREFQSLAHQLGLDALVEVHTLAELAVATTIEAKLIGVNNRDLKTFGVSLDVSRELIKHRPDGSLMIAESGISSREQIDELRSLGFDGFLVGESLMRAGSMGKLKELAA
jgi:indole-3-glycerol phosphate synthase